MNAIIKSVQTHPALWAAFGTWLLGNIVSSLPTPGKDSSGFYSFLFKFLSLIGSELPRSIPQLRYGGSNITLSDALADEKIKANTQAASKGN